MSIYNFILESTKSNIKNIVFDFGEVLIKSDKTFANNYYKSTLEPKGFTEDEFESFVKGFFKFSKEHDGEDNIDKKYKKTIDKKWYPYYNDLINYCVNIGRLFDYSNELLKSLKNKGYKLYYLSNQNKWNWDNYVSKRMSPIMKYFKGGIISCDVGLRKPDKKIYELLLSNYNLIPEECLFIDDKKKNIDAAKSCNMKARLFNDNCLKYLQNIKTQSIIESKDYSKIDKSFKKKKNNDKFEIIDLNSNKALKYVDEKWRDPNKNGCILVDTTNSKIVGYIYVKSIGDNKGVIGPFKIYESYRGYGLSELLLKEAINKYGGYKLGVYADNQVAINLYKKFGFKIVETKIKDGEKYYIMEV